MSSIGINELLKLSPAEKLRLVEALWDSLAEEPGKLPLPPSHRKELERRHQAFLADPAGSTVDAKDAFEAARKAIGA